jgi:hypothetical protein
VASFVFQIHCTNEFRLYDAIQTLPGDKIIALSPRPDTNQRLERDATVYLWEAGKPYRGLVAKGVVEEPLTKDIDMPEWQHKFCQRPPQPAPRAVIRIEHIYEPPLARDKVREELKAVLAQPSFFWPEKAPPGTIFRVGPTLEPVLDQLR